MTVYAPADPRVEMERRYAAQAFEASVFRGEPAIVWRGGRGAAKTLSLCDFFHRWAVMYPGMTQVWCRWERSKMTDTVLSTFEDEILGIGHPLRTGRSREDRKGYEYPNGSRIILLGVRDDPDATKSMNADLFWFNECGQIPQQIWEDAGGAARERSVGSFPYKLKVGDVNPMPPGHWTNSLAAPFPKHLYPPVPTGDGSDFAKLLTPDIYMGTQLYNFTPLDRKKHKIKLIQGYMADNPRYWCLDPWGFHPPGLKYVQDQLGMMSHNRKASWMCGCPTAQENVVYPEFDRNRHVIHVGFDGLFPAGWPKDWPVWVAYDPGYAHPCAVIFWGVSTNGQHYIVDEIHGGGIDIDTLATKIWEKSRKYRIVRWLSDPRGANQRTQIAKGETVMGYMRRVHQLNFQPWKAASGKDIQDQVEAVRVLLLGPKPLQVFDGCVGTIGEFESWRNKINASGELAVGDDAYERDGNDAMDAIRGIVADAPVYEQTPIEVY